MLLKVIHTLWGKLSREELTKFLLLAAAGFMVMGAQWPIKLLKDCLAVGEVGVRHKANLQLISLFICLPFTFGYGMMVNYFRRETVLYIITAILTSFGALFYFLLLLKSSNKLPFDVVYLINTFYVYADIFSALTIPSFWAFINDVTGTQEAKRGYGLIVFGSQLGGLITTLMGRYNIGNYHLISLTSSLVLILYALCIWLVMHEVRDKKLQGYVPAKQNKEGEIKPKVSFTQGLSLLASSPYVFGLLFLTFAQEIMTTILQMNYYQVLKSFAIDSDAFSGYMYEYGIAIQIVAVAFSLIGTSFFQRKFGVTRCIVGYPILLFILAWLLAWKLVPSVLMATLIAAVAKGLHYALNKPVREELYIPTTKDVKYKAKAWIEVFGARIFKVTGSSIIKSGDAATSVVCFTLPLLWITAAALVGKKYDETIRNNVLVE